MGCGKTHKYANGGQVTDHLAPKPRKVGNTPDGTDLYRVPRSKRGSGDYIPAGALDTGTNKAGGRITEKVYRKARKTSANKRGVNQK